MLHGSGTASYITITGRSSLLVVRTFVHTNDMMQHNNCCIKKGKNSARSYHYYNMVRVMPRSRFLFLRPITMVVLTCCATKGHGSLRLFWPLYR